MRLGRGKSGARWAGAMGLAASGMVWAACAAPALAQSSSGPSASEQSGGEASVTVAIPAGPLEGALLAFGRQTPYRLIYRSELVAGRSTAGVQGSMTGREALQRLLAGTRLSWRPTGAGAITLVEEPDAGASLQLPEVQVDASTLRGWSPVRGYVAGISAAGTRTDTPIIETPQTINVITADEIRERAPRTLAETLRYTPGVVTDVQPGTTYFDRIRVRGFNSVSNFYLDGMQLTPSGTAGVGQVDPYLLERVEVLKGPASVMYGQNGPGGIINMVSRRPQAVAHGEIGFGIGNRNYYRGEMDVGGPLDAQGRVLYRLTTVGRTTDTDIDHTRTQRYAIAPALTWRPGENTTLTLLGAYQRDPDGSSGAYHPAVGTVLPNVNGRIPRNLFTSEPGWNRYDREQVQLGYQLEHRFSPALEFRQSARYIHVDVDYRTVRLGALQPNQRIAARTAEESWAKTSGFNIDNSLIYRFNAGPVRNTVVAGVDYRNFRSQNYSASGTSAALNLNLFAPVYGATIPRLATRTNNTGMLEQYGAYGQVQSSYGNWRLLLGLRQDWSTSHSLNHLARTDTRERDSALTVRTGLVYLFDNGLAPYVSYATSFEPTAGNDFFGARLKPSKGEQWEVGLRYQPPGYNSMVSLSAYQLTRQNVTTADNAHTCAAAPGLANCGNYSVQTGEVRVRGIEADIRLSLTEGLGAILAYTYMNAEVTRSNDGFTGKRPTNTPNQMLSGWLSYRFGQGPLRGLMLGGGARFMGPMYANDANTTRIPGYSLFDASASYDLSRFGRQLEGVSVQLTATNLADNRAVGGCWSASYCDYVPGRTVIGALRYSF
ncbi:TonB-dependent siderophore receptor [Roseococcus pinisoli]|uniref:TonB-dependent siderophore receptor n=1 Tax=Roseococcus pinisoli TaxID=2835040 RepID=A0ABS5QJP1_9PROT|nr:TonB-dependent siderophore receptor [Roseococcus pinisoli]MBS7813626.1 TonB-dependent siderophore receptor [Roseococcus pinisoli]